MVPTYSSVNTSIMEVLSRAFIIERSTPFYLLIGSCWQAGKQFKFSL